MNPKNMMAVIKTGGKQYKVLPQDKLRVEKLEGKEGDTVTFAEVLLVAGENGQEVQMGSPIVKGAKVTAKILQQGRADKVEVVKHKAKKRYNRLAGHRQPFTEVEITDIAVK